MKPTRLPGRIVRAPMRAYFSLLVLLASLGHFSQLRAVSIDWDNDSTDGRWNTAANWANDAVPINPDDAVFIDPSVGPALIDEDILIPRDIRFGDDVGGVLRVGSGVLNHTAGVANLPGWFRMGIASGSSGTYNLSGGELLASRYNIAESAGSTGLIDISGGLLFQTDTDNTEPTWSRIGDQGVATVNISGGMASLSGRVLIGAGPTSGGTVITQTGGVFESRSGQIVIADTSPDTQYNISGGTLQSFAGNPITIGQWDDSHGFLNVSAEGQVIASGNLEIGFGREIGESGGTGAPAEGTVNQTGGLVTVEGNIVFGRSTVSTGTYNLVDGILDLTGGSIDRQTGVANFNMMGGRLQGLGNYNLGDFNQAGGILSAGPPGDAGFTSINGSYSLAQPATLEVSIISESVFDFLFVFGVVTLEGNLSIADDLTPFAPGLSFEVLTNDDNDPIVGNFAGKSEGSTFMSLGGNAFQITYQGGDGNDVVLTVLPEPASGASLLFGVAGCLFYRPRRRFR